MIRGAFPVFVVAALAVSNPEEFVNIAIGSDTADYLSFGNAIPVVGDPWGHTYFSPETNNDRSAPLTAWWFHPWTSKLKGIRCTHQPSPWIKDWGWFRISFGYKDQGWDRWQGWDWRKADLRPYLFGSDLIGLSNREHGRARLEMTAGGHSSWIRMQFPKYSESAGLEQTRHIFIERNELKYCEGQDGEPDGPPNESDWKFDWTDDGKFIIRGFVDNHGERGSIEYEEHYSFRFYIEMDKVPMNTVYTSFDRGDYQTLEFDPIDEDTTTEGGHFDVFDIKIGVSLISEEQAVSNLQQEIGGRSFDEYLNDHKKRWNEFLSVIKVVDSGFDDPDEEQKNLVTFYSNLWRTALYPRNLAEPVVEGGTVVQKHWSPFDPEGRIFDGPLSTDSGFWDAYHCVYTNMALLWPEEAKRTFKGYVNVFREGGWLPQWSAPHYKDSMVGTMSDVSLSDMICKEILDPVDIEDALRALWKDAFQAPHEDDPYRGRRGLEDYRKGFIGRDSVDAHGLVEKTASQTQNHALCDWAIRNAVDCARDIYGINVEDFFSDDELDILERDQHKWKTLVNDKHFPQGKWLNGSFVDPFDKYLWTRDLTEGGPYQYRFAAPHDIQGFVDDIFGSHEAICEAVHEMNVAPGHVHRTSLDHNQFNHEMSEMNLNVWGQYAHNNQPAHEILYVPIATYDLWLKEHGDDPALRNACVHEAQYWIKKALLDLYTPLHYSGDEDNGEMSAWYTLGVLGLYDINPSNTQHQFGSPLFKSVQALLGGNLVSIDTENHCPDCSRVCSIIVGNTVKSNWQVTYQELSAASRIIYSFAPGGPDGLCPSDVQQEGESNPQLRRRSPKDL